MGKSERGTRAVLYIAAAVCGVSIVGVVGPDPWLERLMVVQYGVTMPGDPIFEYGIRVACAGYTFVGVCFLVIARKPSRHAQFVNLGATGLMFTGIVAFMAGVLLELRLREFLPHVIILLGLSGLLFAWSPRRRRKRRSRSRRGSSRRRRRIRKSTPTDGTFGSADAARPPEV